MIFRDDLPEQVLHVFLFSCDSVPVNFNSLRKIAFLKLAFAVITQLSQRGHVAEYDNNQYFGLHIFDVPFLYTCLNKPEQSGAFVSAAFIGLVG